MRIKSLTDRFYTVRSQRENENSVSTYTDYAREGDIAMRQSNLLPSNVIIEHLVNNLGEVYQYNVYLVKV